MINDIQKEWWNFLSQIDPNWRKSDKREEIERKATLEAVRQLRMVADLLERGKTIDGYGPWEIFGAKLLPFGTTDPTNESFISDLSIVYSTCWPG